MGFFKKIKKAVNKTADKAGNVVEDIVKPVGDIFADNPASKALSNAAETAFAPSINAVKGQYEQLEDQIEKWVSEAAYQILLKQAMEDYANKKTLLRALVQAGQTLSANSTTKAILDDLKTRAASKNCDAQAIANMKTLVATPELAAALSSEAQATANTKTLAATSELAVRSSGNASAGSFTLTFGGNAAYGAGVEGSYGNAYGLSSFEVKGVASLGATLGLSAGAEVGMQFGYHVNQPSSLGGPYLSMQLQVEGEIGGGVMIEYSVPTSDSDWEALVLGQKKWTPSGFIVIIGVGLELSAAVGGGYSWTY